MIALTSKAMSQMDEMMINEYRIPSLVLMEQASLRVLEALEQQLNLEDEEISIFCGKGNNGADGLALGRLLRVRGIDAHIFISKYWQKASEGFLEQKRILEHFGFEFLYWDEWNGSNQKIMERTTVYVDGLFGTGLNKTLEGDSARLVNELNEHKGYKVSIDIPSGINGTTGKGTPFFKSDLTVTFAYPKWAHLFRDDLGDVLVGSISFDPKLQPPKEHCLHYLTLENAAEYFVDRPKDSHKGTFGHVGILGGAYHMAGAPLMAGLSALKTGAGLATLWVENQALNSVIGRYPEVMIDSWEHFINKKVDALVIGPGLGDTPEFNLKDSLLIHQSPVLIDADGLVLLKEGVLKRSWITGSLVVTPHPKEMAALMDLTTEQVNGSRIAVAKACSRTWQCVTVLKGNKTIITDGTRVAINLTGNPGMATAGSGDVLSGIIGSLLGQGIPDFEAAVLGTFLHGLSGDHGQLSLGEASMTSMDIIENIHNAIGKIKTSEKPKGWLRGIKEK